MNIKTVNSKNFIYVVIGTVVAIGICTLTFIGITNSVKAAVVNKTEVIPTTYSVTATNVKESDVPKGYVKADYKVKLSSTDKPTTEDMSAEAAAELGAQELWRLFGADLSGKTINMNYCPKTSFHPRAEWIGYIIVNEKFNYMFTIDSMTGENHNTSQYMFWSGNIDIGIDKSLEINSDQYTSLAKKTAEKYQLVSGKVISAEYQSQSYGIRDGIGKNAYITLMVTSDNGQQAKLTFSRYNKEFLEVAYDSCVKQMKLVERKLSGE